MTRGDASPPPGVAVTVALYGPGEVELHRHALLRRSLVRAGLRVWYPGLLMGHSPRAFFRASCWDDDNDGEGKGGGDGDGGPEALLEFIRN